MDNLGTLSIFIQAAETRSFTETGRRLGVTSSAIGKAIAKLEARMGVRLFHRSTRTVTLTPEGALFLERCRRILCEFEAAELELAHRMGAPRGRIRISVPQAGMLIMPHLAEFQRRHPEIELDIHSSDRMVDVIEEGFDAVIRIGGSQDSRLMSRMIGTFRQAVVASPAYFARMGMPRRPEDLTQHDCLHYRVPTTGKLLPWQLSRDGVTIELDLPVKMIANTLDPQLRFAAMGVGIAYLPDFAVVQQLRDGSFVRIFEEYCPDAVPIHVLWPSSRHLSPRLRAFVDFMAEGLAGA